MCCVIKAIASQCSRYNWIAETCTNTATHTYTHAHMWMPPSLIYTLTHTHSWRK